MKTITPLVWVVAATLGLAAATAGPSFAGVAINHTETFQGRQ
ncbi:hypothetical protein [Pseudarthrobacter niigatensis]|uniref:Uncharacterized protein n=1 Tax=Pseudarthrobacter niigatensis TaxID=369935 RepID=A0AAJ1SPM8_9MICC|nr:hypothetical protein [Pseudarthrobacter niigatensis]MDQ0144725.1 hypothetical protein [Pseudarthrobacter niigatensis]MDQ0265372.1 hypothetical protein [Pseudarthrobacter niigatensis]